MQLSQASARSLVESVDYILLDIDGVLWSGEHVFPKIPETIAWLRSIGKKIRFLSNNSTMSRTSTCAKFAKKGIANVQEGEVYTSAYVAALYLQELAESESPRSGAMGAPALYNRNVFVIGMPGLHEELRMALAPGATTYGLELNGYVYHPNTVAECRKSRLLPCPQGLLKGDKDEIDRRVSLDDLNCGVVVAGLDFGFNMAKLACASLCLQDTPPPPQQGIANPAASNDKSGGGTLFVAANEGKRIRFVATNEDPQLPIGDQGALLPGAGSIINALSTVAGRRPDVVCGKPELRMAQALFKHEGIIDPSRCLMVGDRLSTDIAFGNGAGCQTLLVLTGCETLEDVRQAQDADKALWLPRYVSASLADLLLLASAKPNASKL